MAAKDQDLHGLCRKGKWQDVEDYVARADSSALPVELSEQKGALGYTPLHFAALSGSASVLKVLLGKAPNIDCRSLGGCTPLLIAASRGYDDCVKLLLQFRADIGASDDIGRTPLLAAELCCMESTAQLLRNEEIVKEAEIGGPRLPSLLRCPAHVLDAAYLQRALLAAVKGGHLASAEQLVSKGAKGVNEGLEMAMKEGNYTMCVFLLLVQAAAKNDIRLFKKLFGPSAKKSPMKEYSTDQFRQLQCAWAEGQVPTAVPIELASRLGHAAICEQLLTRRGVDREAGAVLWQGCHLMSLHVLYLMKVSWVKKLVLARNSIMSIPSEVEQYLKKVVQLDLSKNQLETIPASLLQLPCLSELNLSYNKLRDLPLVPHWSPSLTTLDLSHNHLTTIPGEPRATSIHTLNFFHNKLTSVPPCISTFGTLHWLDISHNRGITTIPPQITNLHLLTHLNLSGLVNLLDIPGSVLTSTSDSISYLRCKLSSRSDLHYILVDILGGRGSGKSTLAMSLSGTGSTTGASVSHWGVGELTPFDMPFSCVLWDYGSEVGQEAYYQSVHLPEVALHLLVFDLTLGTGALPLELWLKRFTIMSPKASVVIVGTHLDALVPERRAEAQEKLNEVYQFIHSHAPTLQIRNSIAVGLVDGENVPLLRQTVLAFVEEQQVKGTFKAAPSAFQQLSSMLSVLKKQMCQDGCGGVMGEEGLRGLLEQSGKVGGVGELERAVAFLEDMGTLVHHHVDGYGHIYFLDNQWLPCVISKIMTSQALSSIAISGLLQIKHIVSLLEGERLPSQYFKPVLALLDQYDVAVTLDNGHVLVPSMLPCRHGDITIGEVDGHPPYTRYILVNATFIVPGFWGRLVCSVIHLINHPISEGLLSNSQSIIDPGHASSDDNPGHTSSDNNPGHTSSDNNPGHASPTRMQCWSAGILYQSPDVAFKVGLQQLPQGNAIIVSASRNKAGGKVIGQLVDLVLQLATDWYPDLLWADRQGWGQHLAPCYRCEEEKCSPPFLFGAELCISCISGTDIKDSTSCGSHTHTVLLEDMFPDLLLGDVGGDFHCKAAEISYVNPQASFGHGKRRDMPVSMKTYLSSRNVSLRDLRHDTLMLARLQYPLVASVVGVCLHPLATLILENASLGALDGVLASLSHPLPRIVVHRMVWEVAVAMAHIHRKGVVLRDLNAANILVWSVDVGSLVHCKLADLGAASALTPSGARGIPPGYTASKKVHPWVAPEVFSTEKGVALGSYDHRVDVYSLGGLIEQLISEPRFHSMLASDEVVRENSLQVVAFPYLTQLVQLCRDPNPSKRPALDDVIRNLCMTPTQSLVHVHPVDGQFSLRCACTPPTSLSSINPITSTSLSSINPISSTSISSSPLPSPSSPFSFLTDYTRLSICCEGLSGVEVNSYTIDTMATLSKHFIESNQVRCMCFCEQQLLVASSIGLADGVINVLDVEGRLPPQTMHTGDSPICSMVCFRGTIYCGTLEGHCLAFPGGAGPHASQQRLSTFVSEDALVSLAVVGGALWVSHGNVVHFLDLLTLEEVGAVRLEAATGYAFVGQLSSAPEGDVVWGAHLGGNCLSAWSATKRHHLFSMNVYDHMVHISSSCTEQDALMSAVVPVLDTVWVGMATGHILIFHHQELLVWFHPYDRFVRFLVCLPGSGDQSNGRSAMVISGGKEVRDIAGANAYLRANDGKPLGGAGVVMLWEAWPARLCRQMNLLEREYSSSPSSPSSPSSSLTDLSRFKRLIVSGEFKDDASFVSTLLSPGASGTISRPSQDSNVCPIHADTHGVVATVPGGTSDLAKGQPLMEEDPLSDSVCILSPSPANGGLSSV